MSTLNWGDLVKEAGEVSTGYDPLPDGDYDLTVIDRKSTRLPVTSRSRMPSSA